MPSIKDRVADRVRRLRERRPVVDHLVLMQQHYGKVGASQQAGAITYFGFLSFFPILALAFLTVGWVARVYRDAQRDLVVAINQVLPDLVGDDPGQVSVATIQDAAPGILSVGLPLMLYSGLGWVTALRDALEVVFELPARAQPGLVAGKLRDLLALLIIGLILFLSVAVAGFVSAFSGLLLDWVGLDATEEWAVKAIGWGIGFAANVLLFHAMLRLLSHASLPRASFWSGAIVGAIAFELLKRLSFLLLGSTKDQPAFQAFGIALILLVWINYFSRVILYAASWAHTTRAARAIREQEAFDRARMQELAQVQLHEAPPAPGGIRVAAKPFAAGGATALGLAALLRRKKDKS